MIKAEQRDKNHIRPEALAVADGECIEEVLSRLDARLASMESVMEEMSLSLQSSRLVKDWYTTAEMAEILGRSDFTAREWCRLGRIHAEKRACGRGNAKEWVISHDELKRIRNEGLLPNQTSYHHRS